MRLAKTKTRFRRQQKGSALLVSLMVMVGLSLLGLGFVAVSETESAIAQNERNSAQTLAIAEAGARAIVEWFQSPTWTTANNLMPPVSAAAALKRERMAVVTQGTAPQNIGVYKPSTTFFCCDRPFRPGKEDRLFGTEDWADIQIDTTTAAGRTFLAAFNDTLFPGNDGGTITEIRVYAPPITGATMNTTCPPGAPSGSPCRYYDTPSTGEQRYGVATIRATATKYNPPVPAGTVPPANAQIIAQRTVKIIVAEYPFPGPQGPVQSNANIQTGGDMIVHWGKMTSQGTMFVKRGLVGLPWFDAYTRIPFERGYDSARIWKAGEKYYGGEVVYPTTGGAFAYVVNDPNPATLYTAGPNEPAWQATVGSTFSSVDGIPWKCRQRPMTITDPNAAVIGDLRSKYDWLFGIIGKDIQDPWVQVRTRGTITNSIITSSTPDRSASPQPFKYSNTAQDVTATPDVGFSNWFQLQATNNPSEYQQVIFPVIQYQFWKETARSGRGTQGIYYLQWVSGENFTDGTQTQKFAQWTNIASGAIPGFYFFDTMDGQNPQTPGANNLTPGVTVNASDGNPFTMAGFIYLNAQSFGTQGVRGVAGHFNFPGEPFEDVGYFQVTNNNWTQQGSSYAVDTTKVGNNQWDYQDVNGNGRFDLKLRQVTRIPPGGTPADAQQFWIPAPYVPGCTIGVDCSEPHEPYLNIIYPDSACCTNAGNPVPVRIGWEDPNGPITRRPKAQDANNNWPSAPTGICTDSSQYNLCTSNEYDKYGFADYWDRQDAPVLNGVFYNQGTFESTGNARYFGSVLINGNVDPNGTNEVWFDERLVKSDWPPQNWPFPRVIISAVQTDQ